MDDGNTGATDEGSPAKYWGSNLPSISIRLLLVLVLILVIGATVWLFPTLLARFDVGGRSFSRLSIDERLTAVNDVRTTLLQLLGVLAVGLAGLVGWSQLKLNQRQVEDSSKANRLQQELARQSQLSQRMTNSVEQLGNAALGVRVGGVYGLELIAASSPNEKSIVVEILCSFVRGTISEVHQPGEEPRLRVVLSTASTSIEPTLAMRNPDRQAALRVLGRHSTETLSDDELLDRTDYDRFDLSQSEIRRADLALGHFEGANFRFCDLRGANMSGAFFESTNFAWASLAGANLAGADLTLAALIGADLRDVDFSSAQLMAANFDDAFIAGATFHGADLRGVVMDSVVGAEEAFFRNVITDEQTRLPLTASLES